MASSGNDGTNPFDFDVDFDKVQKRREQYLARKAAERGETLISGMDSDDKGVDDDQNTGSLNQAANAGLGRMTLGFKNFMNNARASQVGGGAIGGGAAVLEEGVVGIYNGKKVMRWPYDDYHVVQQQYYAKLEELGEAADAAASGEGEEKSSAIHTPVMGPAGLFSGIGAKIGGVGMGAASTTSSSAVSSSTNKTLQRPADPPDIPTAVLGLPLSEFERKAEERAIAIVSTWLFDCGLIDELLVHGGMGKSTMQAVKTNNVSATAAASDNISVPSQEGIEIGTFSHTPIEGPSKMDKEIAKLRGGTARQLALVNSRLNDGVAASGGEVQELVNAVNSTKDDLGRLRELSTYISNTGDVQSTRSQTFMLTRYPKLKKAINARRNLARCFRELDFYSQIPLTCDRLREELHSAEWTEVEWSSLREVSREHVELEIFLVEAEAGMKKRIDEEAAENAKGQTPGSMQDHRRASINGGGSSGNRYQRHNSFIPKGGITNYEEVDNFLHEHVKNVWELGDEIRMRIMSGIGSAFELAMNNPAGLVALIEAVEVYETANEEYKTVHGEEAGSNQNLRFTDMRASALKQMYQDFELRGLEVFREVHEVAQERGADENEDAANEYFNSILRACNGLTSEISFVQNQMSPCFPEYWALEMLWSTCVAHVCSKQILDQIGGKEGHRLPDLTVTQLLDLVAWIETFRSTIEESFPNIGEHISKKTYFDKRPDLLQEDNRQVDMDVAKDSLAWANNMLWEVHDLAKDEFLFRTKEQTDEWFDNVYEADHTKSQTSEGRLITSLSEDVYSVAGVQLRTIQERLTRRSEALVQAVGVIFKNLYDKQIKYRNNFLHDFETCCAAANDFIRMSEQCEEMIADLMAECNLSQEASEQLEEQSSVLLGLYSGDAVFAAQKVHVYIFEPIEEAISEELFSEEWLNELTGNELALTLVKTLEDFMGDLEEFVDELMVGKTLDALVTATIIFYLKCLFKKAAEHKNSKGSLWSDNQRALDRMKGDIDTMRGYFEDLQDGYPALKRAVPHQFEILDTVHELLAIAAGLSNSSDRDFIIVLQKRIRNIPITKLVVGDLWHLVNPTAEKAIYEKMEVMETELCAVAPNDPEAFDVALARQTVPGLRLDQELAMLCDKNKRSRPGYNRTAAEAGQAMIEKWRKTWDKMVEEIKDNQ
ncbi:exocyst complex component Sec6 [Nitzschia inconspicua]|uniref:Exocyst complex component Sec6 n=1 Tax=Nitzschia inconspicua TaxID=303405 RepID=A0A9K3KHJ2_9STRA|nr:exocyst complex component Sec6 [Nitzschia inconspicua]